jgi:hypothetical protein
MSRFTKGQRVGLLVDGLGWVRAEYVAEDDLSVSVRFINGTTRHYKKSCIVESRLLGNS